MQGVAHRIALVAVATVATCAALAGPASAAPAAGCDLVAATNGSDSGDGTPARPLRTAQVLVDSLEAGQTGCLHGGTYSSDDQVKLSIPGITLTSYPGERALIAGRLWVAKEAPGSTVSDLDLDGRNRADNPSPTINASDVTISGNDITNHKTDWYCLSLGNLDSWGRADGAIVEGNRIHDCGILPATNQSHGIYVAAADDVVIRDNFIYDNADRGIQLYPDAHGALISGNVIDGNGSGIIISGAGPNASSDNVIENNVITNSRIRDNVESNWESKVGSGNVVRDNCIGGGANDDGDGGILEGSNIGFEAVDNLITIPAYANRAAGNFTIPADDPCAAILAGAAAPTVATGSRTACVSSKAAVNRAAAKVRSLRDRGAARRPIAKAKKSLKRARARANAACRGPQLA